MDIGSKAKKWSLQYCPGNEETDAAILKLSRDTGLSAVMSRIMHTRGCQTAEEVEAFLHLDSTCLHNPYIMQDVSKAVERIAQAIEKGEKIAVYGDYDVDGVTAVSLLYLYLEEYGADVEYYIPSRIREGYGLSKAAIDMLKTHGVSLMVTVDTGITAIDEIEYAASLGIETVVTDHHECRDVLPNAVAVVNPHRPDDEYPFAELAGVGVVFKLICAYEMAQCRKNGESEKLGVGRVCREYADLVAIGTIADVMPIIDENRLIVAFGLNLISNTDRYGLRALIDAASANSTSKKRKINSGFIGFGIAPRMNAAGRVSSASIAVELLLSDNRERAAELADQLCELNVQRQIEENRIADQAYRKIEQTLNAERDRVIVIDDDTWQQGIIGIVSSRITEKYGLPSILISFEGSTDGEPMLVDIGKGSGRSIRGMNLVDALAQCEDLLVRFGGHELAAGLTIRRCNVDAFRERINEYAASKLDEEALCVSIDADCEVDIRELSMQLAKEIDYLEPFGISNPIPNFILRNATISRVIPMGNGKHTKFIIEKDGIAMSAIWFGMSSLDLPVETTDPIDVLFQLNINEYQNTTSLQMIVQDIRVTTEYENAYQASVDRYTEISAGARFDESEDVVPTRDDFVPVYKILRKEFYSGRNLMTIRRMLGLLKKIGGREIGYIKLKFIIRIMQELQLCEVFEATPDHYIFSLEYQSGKTNIEKSSILRKLKAQMNRTEKA